MCRSKQQHDSSIKTSHKEGCEKGQRPEVGICEHANRVFTFAPFVGCLVVNNHTSHRQVHQARTHIDNIQPHTK